MKEVRARITATGQVMVGNLIGTLGGRVKAYFTPNCSRRSYREGEFELV